MKNKKHPNELKYFDQNTQYTATTSIAAFLVLCEAMRELKTYTLKSFVKALERNKEEELNWQGVYEKATEDCKFDVHQMYVDSLLADVLQYLKYCHETRNEKDRTNTK
jgi:hypothetical protein